VYITATNSDLTGFLKNIYCRKLWVLLLLMNWADPKRTGDMCSCLDINLYVPPTEKELEVERAVIILLSKVTFLACWKTPANRQTGMDSV